MEHSVRMLVAITISLVCMSFPSLAGISEGLQYLSTQLQADGTIKSQESIATPYQSTSEALSAWSALDSSNKTLLNAGLTALEQNNLETTEHLSRLIMAKADLGYNSFDLADRLLTHQNADGGFGEFQGYESTVLDTLFALQALANTGRTSTQMAGRAVYYLVTQQSPAGFFSLENNQPSVYITALASITLQSYQHVYSILDAISTANHFLLAQGVTNSGEETFDTALKLLAVSPTVSDKSLYQNDIDSLSLAQQADGSWNNDSFVTALALRALHKAKTATPQSQEHAAIAGKVSNGQTGEALANVVIVVKTSDNSLNVATNSEGYYAVNNLAPGEIDVMVNHEGYIGVSSTLSLTGGKTETYNVSLLKNPHASSISLTGNVMDAVTLSALAGADIRVKNSGYQTQSNAQGGFELVGMPAGAISVEIAKAGYIGKLLSISAPAGGAIDVGNVALSPSGVPGTDSMISGVMTDAVSGLPLQGVLIAVSGSDNRTIFTGQDGHFVLNHVVSGNLLVSASLDGYRHTTGSFTLAAGVNLEFNAAMAKNADPALLALQGQIVDANTQTPLTGAKVLVNSATVTKSVFTDAQGLFYLGGIDSGLLEVDFSASGYNTQHYRISADGNGLIDLAKIKLAPTPTNPANQPPVINSVAPTLGSVGELYEYRPQVIDPENQYLQFSLSNYPQGMSIDSETGIVRWIPIATQVGSNQFTLIVNDSEGTITEEQVTVTIRLDGEPGYLITDEQTLNHLKTNKLLESEYVIATYRSGGADSWQSGSPNGCGLSYVEAGADPFSIASAANAMDFRGVGIGKDNDAVWDLGQPLASVSVLSLLEQGPLPEKGVAYTVWGSNDPDAVFPDAWSMATLVTIYQSGWTDNAAVCGAGVNSDDYSGFYSFGSNSYRYIRLKAANSVSVFDTPEHTTFKTDFDDSNNDGWQSATAKIDAVLGLTCTAAPHANAGDDIIGLTEQIITFDASSTTGSIANYAWDVDGDKVIDLFGPTPQYSFSAGFDRDVDLYVIDSQGCVGHDTVHVTIGLDYPQPDLQISVADTDKIVSNWQTLTIAGSVDVIVKNTGNAPLTAPVNVTLFEDRDGDGQFNAGIDNVVGMQTTPAGLARDSQLVMTVTLSGETQFRDSPILTMVDSDRQVDESDEENNVATPAGLCSYQPSALEEFNFAEKWYHPGGVYGPVNVVQVTDDNGDGSINAFDNPDIIFPEGGNLTALDGKSGNVLWVSQGVAVSSLGSSASADIDGDGIVEFVIPNSNRTKLLAFEHDGTLKWSVNTGPTKSDEPRDAVAIADIDHDGDAEIIHGRRAYDHTGKLLWEGAGDYGGETGYGTLPIIVDLDQQGAMEILAGRTAYKANGVILWRRTDLPSTGGFTAIGNFNQDDNPEVVLVAGGKVYLLDNLGKTIWGPVTLPGGGTGGAPTVGDFDGDGQPEIGIAGATRYVVLESNGAVKWTSPTQDASSFRTGSSLFDFNLDGKAEVAYADELYLRIYDGATGKVLKQQRVGSGTTLEYPVIADVDADGKAEIVVGSNDAGYSSRRGLLVFEDVKDNWAPTRSIWNQHSYHIDNINDDGSVPQFEQPSWLTHNSYRLNSLADRDPVLLTDITASMLRISHNHANQTASIGVRIGNAGADDLDSRIGIAFYEGDPSINGRLLGSVPLDRLEKGRFQEVVLDNVVSLTGSADIYVIADVDSRIPECNETNNRVVLPVFPQSAIGRIDVATDRTVYGPFSPVYLQGSVTNNSGVPGEFKAALSVLDDQGVVVKQFDTHGIEPLAGGASQTLAEFWQTEQYQAGIYHARGQLFSRDGTLIQQHESTFEIRHAVNGEPLAALRTTTDKAVYHTTDSAQIFNLVQNLAINQSIDEAILQINIYNPSGISVYSESQTLGALPGNGSRDFVSQYSFVQATEGSYIVTGLLKSQAGSILAQGQAHFEVQAEEFKQLSGTVQVQTPTLDKGQLQICTDTLSNTGSQNFTAQSVRQLLVNMDSGEIILSRETAVDVPLSTPYSTTRQIATHNLVTGGYACILQQRIANAWYTVAHQTFVLTEPPIKIEGQLSAGDLGRVLILLDDAPKHCKGFAHAKWEAAPATPFVAGASVTVSLYDAGGDLIDRESGVPDDRLIDRQAGAGVNLIVDDIAPTHVAVSVTTDRVNEAGYRILVTADDGSISQTMDSGAIAADNDDALTIGKVYGNLRLTEVRKQRAANEHSEHDTHDPDLASQRSKLETLLTAAGWSYAIATDADSFTRELRSGGYAAYLLLSEKIKLDEAVQKELREAVYRGEGLIEAGGHDQRQGRIDQVLGVKFLGKYDGRRGIALLPNDWTSPGEADFQLTDQFPKTVLDGAAASGVFTDHAGNPTTETAVTIRSYGQGKSLYVGFDLAAELAMAAPDSLFETLLLDALAAVQPVEFVAIAGGTYPLRLTLNNLGIATPGRVQLPLPDGVGIVDAGSATVEGQILIWPFNLAQAETRMFDIWLKLPAEPLSLDALVQSGIAPNWLDQSSLALNLTPVAPVTVDSVRQQAALLTGKDYKQTRKYLDWAQANTQAGRWADALAALIRASDALILRATPESAALRLQVAKAILGIARHIEKPPLHAGGLGSGE